MIPEIFDTESEAGSWLDAFRYSPITCAVCGFALCDHSDADFTHDGSGQIAERDRLTADVAPSHSRTTSDKAQSDHA